MTMKESIAMRNDYLLVKPHSHVEQKTKGGIVLPNVEGGPANSSGMATVIAVGDGVMLESGIMRPAPCAVGDHIYFFGKAQGIILNGEQVFYLQNYQVCGIVTQEPEATDKPAPQLVLQ